jgi:iron complex transport system ATP-binding protein
VVMIKVSNATFAYDKADIFRDINLEINEGEVFCLFGPNGCGKSTLIQCILGILSLKSGSITLRGQDVRNMKPQMVAREAAYIPQVHDKPFPFKVIDVVIMGRTAYTGMFSLPGSDDRKVAEEALERVGISHFRDRPYTQLSGGETQLVLVARALAQQTPALIMDEPTAHLDFRNELGFLETVVKLVKSTGITVVMATHSPNHALYFEGCKANARIALMNAQRIAFQGKPSLVLTVENMASTFNIDSKVLPYIWEEQQMMQLVPLKLRETENKEGPIGE